MAAAKCINVDLVTKCQGAFSSRKQTKEVSAARVLALATCDRGDKRSVVAGKPPALSRSRLLGVGKDTCCFDDWHLLPKSKGKMTARHSRLRASVESQQTEKGGHS